MNKKEKTEVSKNAMANTVDSKNQVSEYVDIFENGGSVRVLFIGNSITKHAPLESIGWSGNWGMAASCRENDYVHRTVAQLDKKFGKVDYCIAQLAQWERRYSEGEAVLNQYYTAARDFSADIIIARIGENISREENEKICCKPYYDEMIKYFATNENAKIIITDNFWNIEVLNKIIKEVAEENGYPFCHLSDLELDERTMAKGLFEHAGVAAHPSDYGMQCISDRIMEKINEIM